MNIAENAQKSQEEKNNKLEKHHLDVMKEKAKAFTNDDKAVILKAVPDDMLCYELLTRLTFANGKLKQIRDILKIDT